LAKILGIIFVGVAIIAAVLDPVGFRSPSHAWMWWAVQLLAIVLVLFLIRHHMTRYYQEEIRPPRPRTINDIPEVPEDEAYALQRLAGRLHLDARQARILALAILEPAEIRDRVAERYVPGQRTLMQEVSVDAKIPERIFNLNKSADATRQRMDVLLPVIIIPKGSFSDNLEVYGRDDDERIPVLSYREYLQLMARLLRIFLYLAYGVASEGEWREAVHHTSGGRLEENVDHLEHQALCEIIKRAPANIAVKELLGVSPISPEADAIASRIEKLKVPEEGIIYLRLAGALIRRLSLHYALVTSTISDEDGRLLIRYQRTLIPELDLSPRTSERSREQDTRIRTRAINQLMRGRAWLQILVGARPISVTVSLDNAWTCQSYHVRVEAPEGLYLSSQRLLASKKYLSGMAKDAPTPPHYRFRRRLGQSYAHFYGRFFPDPLPDERRPKLRLEFWETPPGSVFRAVIASGACLALVWLVGFVMSRTREAGTDAPEFLLVFPGIAATWLGFDVPRGRLFEGTLAARLSLILTTVISVSAAGLFVMNASGLSLFYGNLPTEKNIFGGKVIAAFSVLGITKWSWSLLLILALINTICLTYRWICTSWRFKHLSERRDPSEPPEALRRSERGEGPGPGERLEPGEDPGPGEYPAARRAAHAKRRTKS
jgi:hypothetical protein